jgi:outer membrane protein
VARAAPEQVDKVHEGDLIVVHGKHLSSAAIAALLFTGSLAAQQPGTTTPPVGVATTAVTLDDALRLSRSVSPSVVQAQGSVRSAELGSRTAKVALFPQLTVNPQALLSLSNGPSRLDPVTQQLIPGGNSTQPRYTFGASANWLIFDGFQRNYTIKARKATEVAAGASLVTAQFTSDFNVTTAFFNALAQRQQVAVAQSNVDATSAQLRLASAKLHAGSGVISDSLTALNTYLQARLQLLSAQSTLVVDETNLGHLVGTAGQVKAIDDSSYYQTQSPIDTASVRQDIMTTAPVLTSLQAALESSEQSVRASKAAYLPTLSLQGAQSWTGYYADRPQSIPAGLQVSRSLTATLSFSPWTNFQRETQIENNEIQMANAQASLLDARNAIAAQINQAYALLSTAQETVAVSAAAVAAGTEALRVVTQRYQLGVATITDVLLAQNALVSAQSNQLSARYSYLLAKAQIAQIAGRRL